MTPPTSFVKQLTGYDRALRVLWSPTRECWLIERKVRRARPSTYFDSPDPDVCRRARDGYIHVGNVAPGMLDERVLVTLWQNDMWAHGGAKTINALLDDYHETKARRADKTQRDDLKAVAGDMWDMIAWKRKGKIVVGETLGGSDGTTG